jgi:Na+:H+ antiporter
VDHPVQLLLLLAIIVAVARVAGVASRRLGQPAVLGEILGGLLLGPSALNLMGLTLFAPAPDAPLETGALFRTVADLAELGVIFLMFVAGLETNLRELTRVGRTAFWVAMAGVALPFLSGAITASAFGVTVFPEGLFVGAALTATSVSISAQTLIELGALRSTEGSTILAAAIIDDVLGILVLSAVVAFTQSGGGAPVASIAWLLARMVLYFGLAVLCARLFEPLLSLATRLHVPQGALAAATVLTFLYAWAAEYVGGIAAISGAYLAGVLFARTRYREEITEAMQPVTYAMLVPVFFISIGLAADLQQLGTHMAFTAALVLVAIVSKAGGCAAAARLCGFSGLQSTRVGAGMVSRGEVGLIVAGYGLARGIIDREIFSAVVVVVLGSTLVTPVLLRATFPRGLVPASDPAE